MVFRGFTILFERISAAASPRVVTIARRMRIVLFEAERLRLNDNRALFSVSSYSRSILTVG